MPSLSPLYISGNETGLVEDRQQFILPADAYPILENAYVWREQLKRKQGCKILGRLRRVFTAVSLGNSGASPWSFNLYSTMSPAVVPETNAQIEPGSVSITINVTLIDQGDGTLQTNPVSGVTGTINYISGDVVITGASAGVASTVNMAYFPTLPVMGLLTRDLAASNNEMCLAFDTKYAYAFTGSGWQEFIPGTTWTGFDFNFFWGTNYWNLGTQKLFWVTNFSGLSGDPIRYTDGSNWIDFGASSATGTGLISTAPNIFLNQCLCLVPFRGRLVAFNTYEGTTLGTSTQYPQRIRWAAIGNPLTIDSVGPPATTGAWRDDIPGRGGYLDIPTTENIVSVGFVRDNLVVFCERSTWQLRYTGRSISPFQIEKVNTELGCESTFSSVQFDTSVIAVGDKGIVECDSYKSERIDIKIPDLVFHFNNNANGPNRVYGIRDFQKRLAFWTYPYQDIQKLSDVYPNRRLVYNYENDSWAIFIDSFTCFGTFQAQSGRRWQDYTQENVDEWQNQNVPWISNPALFPSIVAGNQQGYVLFIDQNVKNDVSLSIKGITGNITTPTSIFCPSHNLETDQIIQIENIPTGDFSSLNQGIFSIVRVDNDNFLLYKYSTETKSFSNSQLNASGTYIGGGEIAVLDNFRIVSKKFNFLEQGQTVLLSFIDILMNTTTAGGISMNAYIDYNNNSPVNTWPQNSFDSSSQNSDEFFNTTIPTILPGGMPSSKLWQRVYCAVRGSFITIEYTLSDAQMIGAEQASDVQIDAQILWMRPAGRQLPQGF